MKSSYEIDKLFNSYEPEIANLAGEVRAFLINAIAGSVEMADIKAKVVGYGYGEGYTDLVCTLLISKQGIKIGFNRGASLPDPAGMLVGSGKVHRYVIVPDKTILESRALTTLIHEALAAWRARSKGKKKA